MRARDALKTVTIVAEDDIVNEEGEAAEEVTRYHINHLRSTVGSEFHRYILGRLEVTIRFDHKPQRLQYHTGRVPEATQAMRLPPQRRPSRLDTASGRTISLLTSSLEAHRL